MIINKGDDWNLSLKFVMKLYEFKRISQENSLKKRLPELKKIVGGTLV